MLQVKNVTKRTISAQSHDAEINRSSASGSPGRWTGFFGPKSASIIGSLGGKFCFAKRCRDGRIDRGPQTKNL